MFCKQKSVLNGLKYYYVTLTTQIEHQIFVYTQLNEETDLFPTFQFCISHLFALSLNFK